MISIITLKKQKYSQSGPVLTPEPPIFKKNCSPIQSWSGQNWLHSWNLVRSSPVPCSSLLSCVFFMSELNVITCTILWSCNCNWDLLVVCNLIC